MYRSVEQAAVVTAAVVVAGTLGAIALKAIPEQKLRVEMPQTQLQEKPYSSTEAVINYYSKRSKSQAVIDWLRKQRPNNVTLLDCSKELNIVRGKTGDKAVGGLVATTDLSRGNYERDVPGEEGKILGGLPRETMVTIPRIVRVSNFGSDEIWTEGATKIDEEIDMSQRPTFTFLKAEGKNPVIYMNLIRGNITDCVSVNN